VYTELPPGYRDYASKQYVAPAAEDFSPAAPQQGGVE